MVVSSIWRRRLKVLVAGATDLLWVISIYLASELAIWGLSRTLAPVHLEFFASILGMVSTFLLTTMTFWLLPRCDGWYQQHFKAKVDFINSHLGLGFPIPLVMLNQSEILDSHEIGRIIGNFAVTNVVSWTIVFTISLLLLSTTVKLGSTLATSSARENESRPLAATPPRIEIPFLSDLNSRMAPHDTAEPGIERPRYSSGGSCADLTADALPGSSRVWHFCTRNFPIPASLLAIFAVGVPVAAATGEERILDGCVLWFVWIGSVRTQKAFKSSGWLRDAPNLKNAGGTLMNPVLATTLLMTGYTRSKAAAWSMTTLGHVLSTFSSGIPLYTFWTSALTGNPQPNGNSDWFGAGDAALSILECGILIWGFKLYECRRQLFSVAGLLTILISMAAAAGNVFLAVLSGRIMKLKAAESLAFAARCTTLALAKPGMVAVGGNVGANAALVVSNGILGQLMYPFMLSKLGVIVEDETDSVMNSSQDDLSNAGTGQSSSTNEKTSSNFDAVASEHRLNMVDGAMTIAAGIAIGINGAAMGVAYLYDTKSRAAPYAALAMTVFGIMTVLYTTVEPFTGVVIGLAG